MLRGLACDEIQSFLIARPMPAEEVRAFLLARATGARLLCATA